MLANIWMSPVFWILLGLGLFLVIVLGVFLYNVLQGAPGFL